MNKKQYLIVLVIVMAAFVLGVAVGTRNSTNRGYGKPPGVTSPYSR